MEKPMNNSTAFPKVIALKNAVLQEKMPFINVQ